MNNVLRETPVCEVCGNELGSTLANCPFCGAHQKSTGSSVRPGYRHKLINLKDGRPIVDAAMDKLVKAVDAARIESVTVLTVIHGYGSSGKGGAIRVACRELLKHLKDQKKIQQSIPGEQFDRRATRVKDIIRRFPALGTHSDLGKKNPGITIVIV